MPAPMDPMTSWSIVIALGLGSYVYFHPTVIRQVESYVKKRMSPDPGSGPESGLVQDDDGQSSFPTTSSSVENKKSTNRKKKKNSNNKKTRSEPEPTNKSLEEPNKPLEPSSDSDHNPPTRSVLKVVEKPKIVTDGQDDEGFQTVTGSSKKSKSKSPGSGNNSGAPPTRKQRQNAAKKAKAKEAKDLEKVAQEQRLREYRTAQQREEANGIAHPAPPHGGIGSDQARIDATRNAILDTHASSYNGAVSGVSAINDLPSELKNGVTTTTVNDGGDDWVTVPEKVRKPTGTAPASSDVSTTESTTASESTKNGGRPSSTKSSSMYDVLVWDEA